MLLQAEYNPIRTLTFGTESSTYTGWGRTRRRARLDSGRRGKIVRAWAVRKHFSLLRAAAFEKKANKQTERM